MSQSAIKEIRYEVHRFCRIKKLLPMEEVLMKMALESYYAMPRKQRHKWSLKEVVDLGLHERLPKSGDAPEA